MRWSRKDNDSLLVAPAVTLTVLMFRFSALHPIPATRVELGPQQIRSGARSGVAGILLGSPAGYLAFDHRERGHAAGRQHSSHGVCISRATCDSTVLFSIGSTEIDAQTEYPQSRAALSRPDQRRNYRRRETKESESLNRGSRLYLAAIPVTLLYAGVIGEVMPFPKISAGSASSIKGGNGRSGLNTTTPRGGITISADAGLPWDGVASA